MKKYTNKMAGTPKANCRVLGTSADDADYITRATPMQTKRKEYENDPMYKTKQESDLSPTRETAVRKARTDGNVRPLAGGTAKGR